MGPFDGKHILDLYSQRQILTLAIGLANVPSLLYPESSINYPTH
jgi:hypothetical protein